MIATRTGLYQSAYVHYILGSAPETIGFLNMSSNELGMRWNRIILDSLRNRGVSGTAKHAVVYFKFFLLQQWELDSNGIHGIPGTASWIEISIGDLPYTLPGCSYSRRFIPTHDSTDICRHLTLSSAACCTRLMSTTLNSRSLTSDAGRVRHFSWRRGCHSSGSWA